MFDGTHARLDCPSTERRTPHSMSAYISGAVWRSGPEDKGQRFVLLAIADNANDEGYAYPSVNHIAAKCLMTSRHIIRTLNELEAQGWLKREARGKANAYQMNLSKLSFTRPEMTRAVADRPKRSKPSPDIMSGEKKEVPSHDIRDTSHDIQDSSHMTFETSSHDICDKPPHPLIGRTVIEPSIEPSQELLLTPFEGTLPSKFEQFVEALKRYWDYCNRGVRMPFDAKDGKAVKLFMKRNPDLTVEQFLQCLRNKASSGNNRPSEDIYRWIPALMSYHTAPQNEFNNHQTPGGRKHAESRTVVDQNRANLSAVLAKHGASPDRGGVVERVRPDLGTDHLAGDGGRVREVPHG